MASQPNNYQIEKALKDKQAADFELNMSLINSKALMNAEFNVLEPLEDASEPVDVEGELTPLEKTLNEGDLTLTELEKTLTEKQLKFCLAYARIKSGRVEGSATSAAIEAGYTPTGAAKNASNMLKNAVIRKVIKERMPVEAQFKKFSKDFVIAETLDLYMKAKAEVPVMGKDGQPTGFYAMDLPQATRLLDSLAGYLGMKKQELELSGNKNKDAIQTEGKTVNLSILDIGELINTSVAQVVMEQPLTLENEAENEDK